MVWITESVLSFNAWRQVKSDENLRAAWREERFVPRGGIWELTLPSQCYQLLGKVYQLVVFMELLAFFFFFFFKSQMASLHKDGVYKEIAGCVRLPVGGSRSTRYDKRDGNENLARKREVVWLELCGFYLGCC